MRRRRKIRSSMRISLRKERHMRRRPLVQMNHPGSMTEMREACGSPAAAACRSMRASPLPNWKTSIGCSSCLRPVRLSAATSCAITSRHITRTGSGRRSIPVRAMMKRTSPIPSLSHLMSSFVPMISASPIQATAAFILHWQRCASMPAAAFRCWMAAACSSKMVSSKALRKARASLHCAISCTAAAGPFSSPEKARSSEMTRSSIPIPLFP